MNRLVIVHYAEMYKKHAELQDKLFIILLTKDIRGDYFHGKLLWTNHESLSYMINRNIPWPWRTFEIIEELT